MPEPEADRRGEVGESCKPQSNCHVPYIYLENVLATMSWLSRSFDSGKIQFTGIAQGRAALFDLTIEHNSA
jgi:hypothetical protein